MPKKILNINNFSGGLNEKTTPRDLAPNEFQRADNINNEIPGKLTLFGESVNGPYTGDIGVNPNYLETLTHGTGLYHINLDRNVDDESIGSKEYLFINDGPDSLLRIIDITTTGAMATKVIPYGNNASNVHVYIVDGTTRIIPSSTAGTNKPKVFEYYNYNRKLGSSSGETIVNVADTYATEDLYLKPISGGLSDSVAYDVEDLHYDSFFDPVYESEVYNHHNIVVANNNHITQPNKTQLHNELNQYDVYGSTDKGSMSIIAHFTNGASSDTGSNILVSAQYRYGLFCSLVYKNQDGLTSQESFPVFLGTVNQDITDITNHADKNQDLYLMMCGRMGERTNRYSGFKVYWARINNYSAGSVGSPGTGSVGPKYLLCEVDFEKGLRYGGEKDYGPFGDIDLNSSNFNFIFPSGAFQSSSSDFLGEKITTLSVLEPFTGSKKPTAIGRQQTTFKSSVMINRRIYAGNITYYDEHNKLISKNDRILKSLPNKFDYFPTNSFLDVSVEDGDEIIHLATVNSKLLQFKKQKLFIVNCQRDLEFLETTLEFKGCEYKHHVVSGPGFVAWFNRLGVYLYDGQRLLDLDMSKMGQSRFKSIYDKLGGSIVDAGFADSQLGYLSETKEIVITNPSGQILKYDMKSESWSEGLTFDKNANSSNEITRASDADITNFVTTNTGDLIYAIERNGSSPNNRVKLRKWNNDSAAFTANGQILLKTKEYDMESPSVNKSIVNVYINYKRGENVLIKGFAIRNGAEVSDTLAAGSTQALTNTSSDFQTQKIKVSNSLFKHITSFGLEIYAAGSGTIHKDFTINDIQIVFREKVAR